MKRLLIVLILLGALVLGAYASRYHWYRLVGVWLAAAQEPTKTDAIVVISGGGIERIEKGVNLFQQQYAPVLIVSGAAAQGDVSNAAGMAAYARAAGVPKDAIIEEGRSIDTLQNARNVTEIIRTRQIHSFILVSSAYHQRRALKSFQRAQKSGPKVDITSVPATPSWYDPSDWWATPRGVTLVRSELTKLGLLLITTPGTDPN